MHEFKFRRGVLWAESVPVRRIAQAVGTPCFVYSRQTVLDHTRKLKAAFQPLDPLICFSMKANANLAVLKLLVDEGCGLDIVSGGELFKARKVGCPSNRIVFASVGKTPSEIEAALRHPILFFNVESVAELESINRIAGRLRRRPDVCLRINPDIDPKTHRFIATGKKGSKFGMDLAEAERTFLHRERFHHLRIRGIHIHIGSQITQAGPYLAALAKIEWLVGRLRRSGVPLTFLNLGGGLGIVYKDEKPQNAQQFAKAVLPILSRIGLRLILEPGRFIVGNAGILVARVLYIKESGGKKFVIVDSGMNDLIRPSLYGAYHEVVPVNGKRKAKMVADIVGPVCESGDFLAHDRRLARVEAGDYVAVLGTGAYGFTMSSNYNARPRACEVLVEGKTFRVVRRRETYEDLIRQEVT